MNQLGRARSALGPLLANRWRWVVGPRRPQRRNAAVSETSATVASRRITEHEDSGRAFHGANRGRWMGWLLRSTRSNSPLARLNPAIRRTPPLACNDSVASVADAACTFTTCSLYSGAGLHDMI